MSVLSNKLIEHVYERKVVRINPNVIQQIKIPAICPHCLKPAQIAERLQASTTYQTWQGQRKLTAQLHFGTHPECTGGWLQRRRADALHGRAREVAG